ncbi:MAG: DUF975 family protein [Clostridiales bacterium]|nr:DUF975 family protein [Clostridiales bacterium]
MLNRIELKRGAKALTKSARVSAYRITLIFLLIQAALALAEDYVGANEGVWVQVGDMEILVRSSYLFFHPTFPTPVVLFVSVFVWLLGCVLGAGWILYHLGVRRGKVMPYDTLFEGFGFAGKIILLHVLMGVFVFLWACLFIVPGIIAAYRYRFALYNLCENPELGVMEALAMSKAQTKGYKLDLFVLDVTFLGWSLLCALTAGILTIWVAPYVQQTNLAYFDAIKAEKGIGSLPGEEPAEDDTFYPDDRF